MIPSLSIIVDNIQIQSADTINLINSSSLTYKIACTAVASKPDVDLILVDTYTQISLSNGMNNKSSGSCDTNDLCTKVLQVDFQFSDSQFYNMSSLTCITRSNNPQVNLTTSIARNVIISNPTTSKLYNLKIFYQHPINIISESKYLFLYQQI